jgi:hypothetical protein
VPGAGLVPQGHHHTRVAVDSRASDVDFGGCATRPAESTQAERPWGRDAEVEDRGSRDREHAIESGGPVVSSDEFPYRWAWRWRTIGPPSRKVPWFADGVDRQGQFCRVLVRGGMNSALIEFDDGYRVVTSRAGLRRRDR